MVSILICSSRCPHINVEYYVLAPWRTSSDQARTGKGSENQNNIDKWLYCLCIASWICSMVLVGSQTQLFHASKMIFDVPFQTKLSSLYPFWFVYLFLSGIVGTFFLKRKVEIRYTCKHVLWRVDICNILLRGGTFPNILLLINPKYYQLLSEGHPFQIFLCLQRIGAVTLAGRIFGQQSCPPPCRHSGVC